VSVVAHVPIYCAQHTAVDCEWAKTDPNFYVRSPKDSQQPYSDAYHPETGIAYGSCGWGAWQDTLQLNHWKCVMCSWLDAPLAFFFFFFFFLLDVL
jgi:hypothetical protein